MIPFNLQSIDHNWWFKKQHPTCFGDNKHLPKTPLKEIKIKNEPKQIIEG